MKISKPTLEKIKTVTFYTGVQSLIDRKIGLINVLNNDQILLEKTKLKNMRNGKVRS